MRRTHCQISVGAGAPIAPPSTKPLFKMSNGAIDYPMPFLNTIFLENCNFMSMILQVHMHVISQDFDSPCLKNKKHWNSFNTEYFVPCEIVLNLLKKNGSCSSVQDANNRDKKELLSRDLICNQCNFKPKNMPDLKNHLKTHLK